MSDPYAKDRWFTVRIYDDGDKLISAKRLRTYDDDMRCSEYAASTKGMEVYRDAMYLLGLYTEERIDWQFRQKKFGNPPSADEQHYATSSDSENNKVA